MFYSSWKRTYQYDHYTLEWDRSWRSRYTQVYNPWRKWKPYLFSWRRYGRFKNPDLQLLKKCHVLNHFQSNLFKRWATRLNKLLLKFSCSCQKTFVFWPSSIGFNYRPVWIRLSDKVGPVWPRPAWPSFERLWASHQQILWGGWSFFFYASACRGVASG